jgi:hypothetical protein
MAALFKAPNADESAPLDAATEAQYLRAVARLYRESEDRRSTDPELLAAVSNLDVVDDLLERAPSLRRNTFRLYRAALRRHFLLLLTTLPEERLPSVRIALDRLNNHRVVTDRRLPPRTSSTRRKTVPEDDLAMLVRHLNNRRASPLGWALRAAHWMLAGVATGLRPAEWEHARLVGDNRLVVINAKRRGEPASALLAEDLDRLLAIHAEAELPGWIRVVPFEPRDLMWIKAHMSSLAGLAEKGISFSSAYEQCRLALRRACDELWGGSRRISLYTARGQFAANSKAVMPLTDVSALMGHKSSRTTRRNYGKRRYAHTGLKPATSPGQENLQEEAQPERSPEGPVDATQFPLAGVAAMPAGS